MENERKKERKNEAANNQDLYSHTFTGRTRRKDSHIRIILKSRSLMNFELTDELIQYFDKKHSSF